MTTAGWILMTSCWTLIITISIYLVYKTLANPRHDDDE
jgi:hypothetical protein